MLYTFITICIVIVSLLLILSKTNYTLFEAEERVDVLFTASLPQELQANSYNGEALLDMLTVGIYDSEGNEIIRKTTQTDDPIIDFNISLINKYTYNIVLWTHYEDGNTNNIGDMKSIKMLITDNVADFITLEQFNGFHTTSEGAPANQSSIHTVDLASPLTPTNEGAHEKCAKATLKIFGLPASFYLFTNEVSTTERLSFEHHTIPNNAFVADKIEYNSPPNDYLFASGGPLAFESETNM